MPLLGEERFRQSVLGGETWPFHGPKEAEAAAVAPGGRRWEGRLRVVARAGLSVLVGFTPSKTTGREALGGEVPAEFWHDLTHTGKVFCTALGRAD